MNPASKDIPIPAALRDVWRRPDAQTIYPCIEDLVTHGLELARFAAGECPPNRQSVTQYLAAWSRHAGLSEEESRGWLVEFCATMLAPLSHSKPSAIRHSTRSNLRYIYRSAVAFLCEGADNPFHAVCSSNCPVYAEMQAKRVARAEEAAKPKAPYVPPEITVVPPVKAANRAAFAQALSLVAEQLQQGKKPRDILKLLYERDCKTRTGRKWTKVGLSNELAKLKARRAQPPAKR